MVAERCLAGHMLQKPGDRVHRLVHRGHAHQSLKQVGLGEPPLDGNSQVVIQGSDRPGTTLFRFEVATCSAGCLLPLDKRHEEAPATYRDLSILCGFQAGEPLVGFLKLKKYCGGKPCP